RYALPALRRPDARRAVRLQLRRAHRRLQYVQRRLGRRRQAAADFAVLQEVAEPGHRSRLTSPVPSALFSTVPAPDARTVVLLNREICPSPSAGKTRA